jgi:orotate phosphoribosyltransferase-like protein
MSGFKRSRDQVEESKAFAEAGWYDHSNNLFRLNQLSSALMDRNRIRLDLKKKDNEIKSLLRELNGVPQATHLVNALEHSFHEIERKLEKEEEDREAPKKRRKKTPVPEEVPAAGPEEGADLPTQVSESSSSVQ